MKTTFRQATAVIQGQAFFILILAIFLGLVARNWQSTWDDSGITLAFSRNLAWYGDIFPTPLNNRVEGYSTFLWMVLNALFFRLGFSESTVVNLAKIFSTGFAVLNLVLFWKLIAANLRTPLYRAAALTLFAINSYTIASAVDGMETSLYALILLGSYFLYKKHETGQGWYLSFAITCALLVLIRHEGPLFLLPFVAETLRQRRQAFLKERFLYFWALIFLGYHFWHYAFFGELLTNPMLAKSHWPYRPDFPNLEAIATFYLTPIFDFLFRYISVFICLPVHFILRRKFETGNENQENWNLIQFIGLVSVIIILITGQNWGAAARLSYPGLAFLLLLLFSKIDNFEFFKQSKAIQAAAALGLLINLVIIFEGVKQSIPDLITLQGVERRASVLAAAKNALGHPQITVANVDMGGLLLYHANEMKVIDLGMLCDKELARNGYSNYDQYLFVEARPEIIVSKGFWLEPLQKASSFMHSYFPVLVITNRDKGILYLRLDLIAELETRYTLPNLSTNLESTSDPIENQLITAFGGYRILDLR